MREDMIENPLEKVLSEIMKDMIEENEKNKNWLDFPTEDYTREQRAWLARALREKGYRVLNKTYPLELTIIWKVSPTSPLPLTQSN